MKRFISTQFFHLMKESSELRVLVIEKTYDDFACFLLAESAITKDKVVFHNILVFTRVELTSLHLSDLSKKNVQNNWFIDKAILLIDMQMEFLRWQLQSEQLVQKCPLHKAPQSRTVLKWTGNIVDMVEMGYSWLDTGSINDGKISLKQLFKELGQLFNIEINAHSRIFTAIKDRSKRMLFVDRMKKALMDKIEETEKKQERQK